MLLIYQELTERGHLDRFLDKLCILEDKKACAQTVLPKAQECQAVLLPSISNTVLPVSEHNSFNAALQCASEPQELPAPAEPHHEVNSISANADSLAEECPQEAVASMNNHPALVAGVPSGAPSVLDAAIAAYKQEKRQLWKVRAGIVRLNRVMCVMYIILFLCLTLVMRP